MSQAILTPKLLMAGLDCPRKAWLGMRSSHPQLAMQGRRRRDGDSLASLARSLFPDGEMALGQDLPLPERAEASLAHLRSTQAPALFDVWFCRDSLSLKVDLVVRGEGGWQAWMIKASGSVKGRHIEELALAHWLMKGSGVPPEKCLLGRVNREFVWKGPAASLGPLLAFDDLTYAAQRSSQAILRRARRIQDALTRDAAPEPFRRNACRDCPFQEECFPGGLGLFDVAHLPGSNREVQEQLARDGITDVRTIPEDFSLTDSQAAYVRRSKEGTLSVSPDLKQAVLSLPMPALYVDFEVDQSVFPWLPNTSPYDQTPFLHCTWWEDGVGLLGEAGSFLWPEDARSDQSPKEAFVAALLPLVREAASVVVYSDFERRTLAQLEKEGIPGARELSLLFEEKEVDLLKLLQGGFRHPELLGGYSIKNVLPVLCPDMSDAYVGLEVQDGDMAVDAFQVLRSLGPTSRERESLGQALRDYCSLDVLAMIRIVWALRTFARA